MLGLLNPCAVAQKYMTPDHWILHLLPTSEHASYLKVTQRVMERL